MGTDRSGQNANDVSFFRCKNERHDVDKGDVLCFFKNAYKLLDLFNSLLKQDCGRGVEW